MRPVSIDIYHAYEALDIGDIDMLIGITSKWSWPWDDMAAYAASIGDRDATIYLIEKADSIDTIYRCMYEARTNGHYNLFRLLERIARTA